MEKTINKQMKNEQNIRNSGCYVGVGGEEGALTAGARGSAYFRESRQGRCEWHFG